MADFPALPLWTDAYVADTLHLDVVESGAYLHLLIAAWRTPDCALPDDDARLARWARCSPRQWKRIRETVLAFWDRATDDDGRRKWTQKRLLKERSWAIEKSRKASTAARSKALKNKHQVSADAGVEHMPEACPKPAPIPIPIPNKIPSPSGLGADAPAPPLMGIPLVLVRPRDNDWRKAINDHAVPWLRDKLELTAKQAAGAIGQMRNESGGSDQLVFATLADAQRDDIADPVRWAIGSLRSRRAEGETGGRVIDKLLSEAKSEADLEAENAG